MTTLIQKRFDGTWEPYDEDSAHRLVMFAPLEVISVNAKKPRNPQFHRLVFKFLNTCFENQDSFDNFERFYDKIKLRAGLVEDTGLKKDGQLVYKIKSFSFENMDETEFREVWPMVFKAGCDEVCQMYTAEQRVEFENKVGAFT